MDSIFACPFLTVGFGDIIPVSAGGRWVTVLICPVPVPVFFTIPAARNFPIVPLLGCRM
ncbi:MAG: hypothetical protein GY940_42815 [bacterium]|nr:hypothetical protein [bacterium]